MFSKRSGLSRSLFSNQSKSLNFQDGQKFLFLDNSLFSQFKKYWVDHILPENVENGVSFLKEIDHKINPPDVVPTRDLEERDHLIVKEFKNSDLDNYENELDFVKKEDELIFVAFKNEKLVSIASAYNVREKLWILAFRSLKVSEEKGLGV